MEKYSFVLEFDTRNDLFNRIRELVPVGRCIRQVSIDFENDLINEDLIKADNGKFYRLENTINCLVDIYYFENSEINVCPIPNCPYAYWKKVNGKIKYCLHLEPPKVKPGARAEE